MNPPLVYVGGSPIEEFRALVGVEPMEGVTNYSANQPFTTGEVVLVQPGLSRGALLAELELPEPHKAQKLIDTLSVAQHIVQEVASFRVISDA